VPQCLLRTLVGATTAGAKVRRLPLQLIDQRSRELRKRSLVSKQQLRAYLSLFVALGDSANLLEFIQTILNTNVSSIKALLHIKAGYN
jgi:hypothetical protein